MNQKLQLPVKLASLLILIALLAAPGVGWGQTPFTATYTFGANGNVASFAYNGTVYDGISMSDIVKVGVTTSSSSGNFRATTWPTASSPDESKYIGFTITAASGYKFTVTSINFGIGRSGTGTRDTQWRGSADSYSSLINNYTTLNSSLTNNSGVINNPDENSNWTGNVLTLGSSYEEITTSCGFRMYLYSAEAGAGTAGLAGPISISGTFESVESSPTISVTPSTLTGFTYALGAGPSAEQSFSVSGSNLTSNVSIDAPTNYEISTGTGVSFSAADPITLTPASGTLNETTIYVRLKSGLAIGNYNDENITASSSGADNATVTCSGNVYDQIDWCNIQWPLSGTITLGDGFDVYGQVWVDGVSFNPGATPGLQAWIGYNTENTNPSTWSNWVAASFNAQAGNNDEYVANLGAALSSQGTYYYAYRYQYNSAPYVYGGTGGVWNNNSGTLTVNPQTAQIDWCNLQWPESGSITSGGTFDVYAQVYEPGITNNVGQGASIDAWIGFSTSNTNPSTWTNWVSAAYNGDAGNNDEYFVNIATGLAPGTYYYASRFKYGFADYVYGGYSSTGGGFWDGTNNVSGVLTVNAPPLPNAWINEFHYDNNGTDVNEFVEVVVENSSLVNLAELRVHLYNGNGGVVYGTPASVSTFTVGVTSNNFTIYTLLIPGIQNGAPDGLALSYFNTLVPDQFLSYEGTFEATDGPAIGVTSVDIGVSENGTGAATNSLQLGGVGTEYADFAWQAEATNTLGLVNNNQSFFSSTAWTGALSQAWELPGNWSAGIPIAGMNVTIPDVTNDPVISGAAFSADLTMSPGATLTLSPTAMLTVSGNLTTSDGLSIQDGASLITNNLVSGAATVQKNISDSDFHLFILPTVQSLPASPTFIGFFVDDYIEANGEWTRLVDTDNLLSMRGYSISNVFGALSLDFTGNLLTGDQTFPGLSYTPAAGGYLYGWNLVGNPFPSAVDPDVASFVANGLNGFAYVWSGSLGNYLTAPLTGGVGTLTGNIIPSAQGFFVRTEAAGANLTIPNAARVHSSQSFYKNNETFENTIMLTASGNGAEDRMMFAVNPESTAGYDYNFDAYKLFGNAEAPQLYTSILDINQDIINLSISSVDVIEAETEFPVMFKAGVDGNYTITSSYPESFMSGSQIILTDNLTGLRHDLRQNPVYAFSAAAGDDANRFKLSFATVGIEEPSGLNIGVYAAGSQIRLVLPELMKGRVNISNLSGQLIYSQNFNGSGELGIGASYPAGVYLVTVISANGSTTRKVFVN